MKQPTQKAPKILSSDFLFGAPDMRAIRRQTLPELAVIGRSNVGKSTFINRLVGRKLARVSSTPGSTRELNFYRVDLAAGSVDNRSHGLCLVDMPGFGFAKLSKVAREAIAGLSVEYLGSRQNLRVVIILNDVRREPGPDELAVQEICAREGIRCIVVVTKFDTLRSNERVVALREVARGYNLEPQDLLISGEGVDTEGIWERVINLVWG
jgi:GTP-binding protein